MKNNPVVFNLALHRTDGHAYAGVKNVLEEVTFEKDRKQFNAGKRKLEIFIS